MNTTRKLILILLLVYSVSCNNEKQQSSSMKLEIDSTTDISVSEEHTFIDVLENALYQDDFNESIKRGDYRFVGVMGFALIIPGVPDYDEKYEKSNSVKIIEGTTDSYEDSVALRIAVFKNEYATSYNKLLLEYLSKDEE